MPPRDGSFEAINFLHKKQELVKNRNALEGIRTEFHWVERVPFERATRLAGAKKLLKYEDKLEHIADGAEKSDTYLILQENISSSDTKSYADLLPDSQEKRQIEYCNMQLRVLDVIRTLDFMLEKRGEAARRAELADIYNQLTGDISIQDQATTLTPLLDTAPDPKALKDKEQEIYKSLIEIIHDSGLDEGLDPTNPKAYAELLEFYRIKAALLDPATVLENRYTEVQGTETVTHQELNIPVTVKTTEQQKSLKKTQRLVLNPPDSELNSHTGLPAAFQEVNVAFCDLSQLNNRRAGDQSRQYDADGAKNAYVVRYAIQKGGEPAVVLTSGRAASPVYVGNKKQRWRNLFGLFLWKNESSESIQASTQENIIQLKNAVGALSQPMQNTISQLGRTIEKLIALKINVTEDEELKKEVDGLVSPLENPEIKPGEVEHIAQKLIETLQKRALTLRENGREELVSELESHIAALQIVASHHGEINIIINQMVSRMPNNHEWHMIDHTESACRRVTSVHYNNIPVNGAGVFLWNTIANICKPAISLWSRIKTIFSRAARYELVAKVSAAISAYVSFDTCASGRDRTSVAVLEAEITFGQQMMGYRREDMENIFTKMGPNITSLTNEGSNGIKPESNADGWFGIGALFSNRFTSAWFRSGSKTNKTPKIKQLPTFRDEKLTTQTTDVSGSGFEESVAISITNLQSKNGINTEIKKLKNVDQLVNFYQETILSQFAQDPNYFPVVNALFDRLMDLLLALNPTGIASDNAEHPQNQAIQKLANNSSINRLLSDDAFSRPRQTGTLMVNLYRLSQHADLIKERATPEQMQKSLYELGLGKQPSHLKRD